MASIGSYFMFEYKEIIEESSEENNNVGFYSLLPDEARFDHIFTNVVNASKFLSAIQLLRSFKPKEEVEERSSANNFRSAAVLDSSAQAANGAISKATIRDESAQSRTAGEALLSANAVSDRRAEADRRADSNRRADSYRRAELANSMAVDVRAVDFNMFSQPPPDLIHGILPIRSRGLCL